ncbi:hypothetical protein [Caballeronia sp. dw_276]|uniref:hypothetical protein n=1 Tax=Caballeronia sp. dw_276 TaxID=2719795 RepID=UPI001BD5B134|nr:hypothetical protein [Caballeronia sp. dw_276]
MRTNKKPAQRQLDGTRAPVVNLASYQRRRPAPPSDPSPRGDPNIAARHALVSKHLIGHATSLEKTLVAAAIVLLHADGTTHTSAIGIEPEYAAFVLRGFDRLISAIKGNAPPAQQPPRQRGFVTTAGLIAIAFAAATYINDIAWLDAALSIAGQIVATYAWKRHD